MTRTMWDCARDGIAVVCTGKGTHERRGLGYLFARDDNILYAGSHDLKAATPATVARLEVGTIRLDQCPTCRCHVDLNQSRARRVVKEYRRVGVPHFDVSMPVVPSS